VTGESLGVYPALGAGVKGWVLVTVGFDGAQVVGEGVGDVLVSNAFGGPAALVGIVS